MSAGVEIVGTVGMTVIADVLVVAGVVFVSARVSIVFELFLAFWGVLRRCDCVCRCRR